MTEKATDGTWFFKSNDDGIFVKLNDQRVKNSKGNLMEGVVDVKEANARNPQNVVITFKDFLSPSGTHEIQFHVSKFLANKNDFSSKFSGVSTAKGFVSNFKSACLGATASSSAAADTCTVMVSSQEVAITTPLKKKGGRKRTTQLPKGVELPSPAKKPKADTLEEEIEAHYIGLFNLKVASLRECRSKWLDRKIDEARVDEIAISIERSPASMHNAQPWLAIADISKEEVSKDKNNVKGANIEVIGGLHRRAAYKKISMASETNAKLLQKVWVNVYDSKLTDEQVCRLAARHNLDNQGSRQTKWIERVVACRKWLYKMAKADFEIDDTPAGSTGWKKACQIMYTPSDKDVNSLEPTLQAALLPRETFNLLLEVNKQFEKGALKGMKAEKPSRKKKDPQLTQNQVGMPLQGLEKETKDDLLSKVINKQYSLKELKEAAETIKKKKVAVQAFLKFTGEEDWESLKKRFPHHATEEKMAQFKEVSLRKGKTSPVLESFFRRAKAWEKEETMKGFNVTEEKNGVFFFHDKTEESHEGSILMEWEETELPLQQLKAIAPNFEGFHLVLVKLEEDAEEAELKRLLLSVHAGNVDTLQRYNIIVINPASVQGLEHRFPCTQRAFWFDSRKKKVKGHLLQNSLTEMIICHWTANNVVGPDSCNLADDSSNVFACAGIVDGEDNILPTELISMLIKRFSFEGQWILDLTRSKGAGIIAGLSANRNTVCLQRRDNMRVTASHIANKLANTQDGPERDNLSSSDVEEERS